MYPKNHILINQFKQVWLWRNNKIWTWFESFILTGLILLFCYGTNPGDPLYLHRGFPWPWLAGVIIVLQYGLGPGLLSAGLIIIAAIYYRETTNISLVDFQDYLLSGTTLLLICAMFSSMRIQRMINAEELLIYTNERLDSLSDSYYMLRLAYDYLEHNVITKPYTLRFVLKELHQMSILQKGKLSAEIGYPFLQVLTQFCSINSVGMYVYKNKKLNPEPIAEIGEMGELDLDDPLINQSIELQDISYVTLNNLENVNECKYLVSIPMVAHDGLCLGYIVIREMSFWTLTTETLTTISVLVAYFVEEITCVKEMPELYDSYPECPSDFARQLQKLLFLHKKLQIDSALCAVIIPKEFRPYNVINNLKRQQRFPDTTWSLDRGDNDVLLTLIPFTNATGIFGFFTRITELLKVDLGLTYTEAQIRMRSMQLYDSKADVFLNDFMTFIKG